MADECTHADTAEMFRPYEPRRFQCADCGAESAVAPSSDVDPGNDPSATRSALLSDSGCAYGATSAEVTTPDTAAIRARLDAATPGPWVADPTGTVCAKADVRIEPDGSEILPADGPMEVAECYRSERLNERADNATFIAHAPEDIRALLAALATLTTQLAQRDLELGKGEWTTEYGVHFADGKESDLIGHYTRANALLRIEWARDHGIDAQAIQRQIWRGPVTPVQTGDTND